MVHRQIKLIASAGNIFVSVFWDTKEICVNGLPWNTDCKYYSNHLDQSGCQISLDKKNRLREQCNYWQKCVENWKTAGF